MSTTERMVAVREQVFHQATLGAYVKSAWAVLAKDVLCEMRAKHAIAAMLLFAVTSTVAVSFTLGPWARKSSIASPLLWLVVYFSAMSGLSRSFVREEETYTSSLLKLAARPNSVYLGKLAMNFLSLIGVQMVTVPLFLLLTSCPVGGWVTFLALLVLGGLGLSLGATTAAAMVAKATSRGALYAVISFPLLLPVLGLAIHGSAAAMDPAGTSAAPDIRLLAYYCGIVLIASLMLFRFIWED